MIAAIWILVEAIEKWLAVYQEILAEGPTRPDSPADKQYLIDGIASWKIALRVDQVKSVIRKAAAMVLKFVAMICAPGKRPRKEP